MWIGSLGWDEPPAADWLNKHVSHPRHCIMPLTPAQRELVEANLPAAQKMASVYLRNVPRHADRDGIRGAASLGLCKAAMSFDPARNNNFASYAAPRIIGEIKDFARNETMLTPHRSPRTVHPSRREMPGNVRDRRDDPSRQAEQRDQVRHLLRRVRRRDQRIVMNGIATGVPPSETASAIGVSVPMYFLLRRRAIKQIKV